MSQSGRTFLKSLDTYVKEPLSLHTAGVTILISRNGSSKDNSPESKGIS